MGSGGSFRCSWASASRSSWCLPRWRTSRSFRSRTPRAGRIRSSPVLTGTCGSRSRCAEQDRAHHARRGRSPSFRSSGGRRAVRDRGRAGRQPLVHRALRATGSDGSPRGADHRVSRSRPADAQPLGHHRRSRRQPLVHRGERATRSAASPPTGAITEFPIGTAAAVRRHRRRARTATSGSPSRDRRPDRADHSGRHDRPSSRSTRRPALPWHRAPAPTATSGSPNSPAAPSVRSRRRA